MSVHGHLVRTSQKFSQIQTFQQLCTCVRTATHSSVNCLYSSDAETAVESDMVDFISEFKMLVRVGKHPNIVSLIGAALSIDEGE